VHVTSWLRSARTPSSASQNALNNPDSQMVYDAFGQLIADYAGSSLQRENIYRGGQLLSVVEAAAAAPASLVAIPSGTISAPTVSLSWTAVSGATNYRVERKSAGASYSGVGTSALNSFTDNTASSGSAYLYRVCVADSGGNCVSTFSNVGLGTAVRFTDDPLVTYAENPGTATTIKAEHITQLRTAVNAVRSLAGLANASWSYPASTSQQIHVEDVAELRAALDLALSTLGIATAAYDDNQLAGAPNGTIIKRAHIAQLRQRSTSGTVGDTQNVTWTSLVGGVQANGNSLKKISGNNEWDAGAVSTQTLSGDGYVEFTAGPAVTWRMCGLGNGNSSAHHSDIEYAIFLDGTGSYAVFESGVQQGPSGSYTETDHFKVAVEGGVVKYYRNSTLIRTSSVTPQFPLLVDTSLNTVNTSDNQLTNVVMSNSAGSALQIRYVLSDVQGSARLTMSGTNIIARNDYLPFGEQIGSGVGLRTGSQGYGVGDTNRQKYALTERDDFSGLDHTWWRKYESTAGRWTTPDPYNGSFSMSNPQSINRYSYVGNDPLNLVDHSGLDDQQNNRPIDPATGQPSQYPIPPLGYLVTINISPMGIGGIGFLGVRSLLSRSRALTEPDAMTARAMTGFVLTPQQIACLSRATGGYLGRESLTFLKIGGLNGAISLGVLGGRFMIQHGVAAEIATTSAVEFGVDAFAKLHSITYGGGQIATAFGFGIKLYPSLVRESFTNKKRALATAQACLR
jgi:RHS repeat-associated protein